MEKNSLVSNESYEQFPNILMAWHANYVNINRRKAIVLMNNETRFSVVIYRPSKKDFSRIKDRIFSAISEALRMEGVREAVIEAYFAKAGEISFSKTANRSMVAKMNNAVREVEAMREFLDESTSIQRYISMLTGRFIQLSGADTGFYPIEKMIKSLSSIYGHKGNSVSEKVLDIDLYQLKIQINLEGHDIWRRVLVPSTYSFRHLHRIIQIVFDWQNYHLHEFSVETAKDKPLKIIVDDDPETLEYLDFDNFEVLQERFVAMKDVFPKYNEVIYEYDFGDSWGHTIILEKVVKANELLAIYLEGNGERPPEDVGGELGFDHYKEIIENKNHQMYQEMKEWAESQKERKLSTERINQRVKQVIKSHGFTIHML